MRLYKAFLDTNFNVLSYEDINTTELIFSRAEQSSFEIDSRSLREYIELNGFVTTYLKLDSMHEFVMYLDIDYKFHAIWDSDTSIHVTKQIREEMRDKLWNAINEKNPDKVHEYIQLYPGIVGEKNIVEGDTSYMFHKYIGGIWGSTNTDVISINRTDGVLHALKPGTSTITYVVDTGAGITTCFSKVIVKSKS